MQVVGWYLACVNDKNTKTVSVTRKKHGCIYVHPCFLIVNSILLGGGLHVCQSLHDKTEIALGMFADGADKVVWNFVAFIYKTTDVTYPAAFRCWAVVCLRYCGLWFDMLLVIGVCNAWRFAQHFSVHHHRDEHGVRAEVYGFRYNTLEASIDILRQVAQAVFAA